MKPTREQFNEFKALILEALDDSDHDEHYGTSRSIADGLLDSAERSLFAEEIAKEERRTQYLALKAEFEPGEAA